MATTGFVTPAQMIESHLRERGWTQRTLAKVLGISEQSVSLLMNGKKISTELALQLREALGIDADQLLKLQASFELKKAELEFRPDPALNTRAMVFGGVPVGDMIARGWLKGVDGLWDSHLDVALCRFFGVSDIDEIEVLPHAAKKTDVMGEATPAQIAWLYRVKQIAQQTLVGKYSPAAVVTAARELKPLLNSAEGARKVPRLLSQAGIRYAIVESLPHTKIDGACMWLSDKSPVIGMTLRFDRIDNFWFVLRHELEHVIQKHGQSAVMLDVELEGERAGTGADIPKEERVANEAAAEFCTPQRQLKHFIQVKSPFFAERDIRGFAATYKIHPGIVAGQLQHKTKRYELFRNHLVKIRSVVSPSAMVDGWGDVAPVG
ncbi:MAG TPA: helix-turn-helix domain-containing protein [Terracidiphilus sp.]|nr:helix-turn-helix domain-containing protein [Terracidiphilus sp.]